ncbi:MAG: type VI secretion system tube protein Hcp [Hyphomonas sp.]
MTFIVANTRRIAGALAASLAVAGFAHAGIEIEAGDIKLPATNLTFSVSQQPVYDPETFIPVEPKRMHLSTGSLYVTRSFDTGSVKVLKHVVDGTRIPAVRVVMTQDGQPGRQVWNLTNAVFNNYSTYAGEGEALIENFDISYETATLNVYTGAGNTPADTVTWKATPMDGQ